MAAHFFGREKSLAYCDRTLWLSYRHGRPGAGVCERTFPRVTSDALDARFDETRDILAAPRLIWPQYFDCTINFVRKSTRQFICKMSPVKKDITSDITCMVPAAHPNVKSYYVTNAADF